MSPDLTGKEVIAERRGGRDDFSGLDLSGIGIPFGFEAAPSFASADFSNTRLEHAVLIMIDLRGAKLRGADLEGADLFGAALTGADLRQADLSDATLTMADCQRGNFAGADLTRTMLEDCDLGGALFDGATIASTVFFDVDVSSLCGATSLTHEWPSAVDARTVMRSYRHPRLKPFMLDCGIPEIFAEYMIECAKALGEDALKELMQSTFISYGGPDEPFARRLYGALRVHGVVTFFFPETARVGERIGNEVFSALQRHDRMILVCSRNSLDRPGVLDEIQETLDREARDGGASYLIPVMIDDYLLTDWKDAQPALAEKVGRRVAADFRDPVNFDHALGRLLAALRKKSPKR